MLCPRALPLVSLLALLIPACEGCTGDRVVLEVFSALRVPQELDGLTLTLEAPGATPFVETFPAEGDGPLEQELVIARGQVFSDEITATVDGTLAGVNVAAGQVVTAFAAGEVRERVELAPLAPPDGGPRPDAGPDAGSDPADAGFDAGPMDAGFDAGPMDAGPLDAGLDAGTPDGGLDAGFDAGVDPGFDAGAFDAGLDAGCPVVAPDPELCTVPATAASFSESVPAAGLTLVDIDVSSARVDVIGDPGRTDVLVETRGSLAAEVAQNGSTLTVSGSFYDLFLRVPPALAVTVNTSAGDSCVARVRGPVTSSSTSGTLVVHADLRSGNDVEVSSEFAAPRVTLRLDQGALVCGTPDSFGATVIDAALLPADAAGACEDNATVGCGPPLATVTLTSESDDVEVNAR